MNLKRWINHLGMQPKLILVVALLLVVALSLTAVLFSFYDRQANQVDFIKRLEAIADVVANRSSSIWMMRLI